MNVSLILLAGFLVQLIFLIIALSKVLISIGIYRKSIESLEIANGNFGKKLDEVKDCVSEKIEGVNKRIDNHTGKIYSEIKEINARLIFYEGRIGKLEGKVE